MAIAMGASAAVCARAMVAPGRVRSGVGAGPCPGAMARGSVRGLRLSAGAGRSGGTGARGASSSTKTKRVTGAALFSGWENASAGSAGLTDFGQEFVVLWPKNFGEIPKAIASPKEGNTVVLNLGKMANLEEQQRSVDFVAGGTHALNGYQECLGEGVFLFAPSDVSVTQTPSAAVPVAAGADLDFSEGDLVGAYE